VIPALVKEPWSEEAGRALARALADGGPDVRAEVEQGAAELFRVPGLGWIVMRIEEHLSGRRELVIVAAVNLERRELAAAATLPGLIALARAQEVHSIRVHSARPGMGRLLERFGFRAVERVYRLEIGDGRAVQ